MTRKVNKVLGKTAQLANSRVNQNLLGTFAVGTTKLSSNNDYSTKLIKKENFINIPKQLHNNKLMNIFVPDFKNYSSSSVNYNNKTIQVLNPVQYEGWSKDEVCSLLWSPIVNGGAGLTIEKVKPLYDAGFDGTSLANIVTCIQDKDKYFAIGDTYNSFPTIAPDTLKSVVFWVDNLLKTRLYHLWSEEQVQNNLCKPVEEGGVGLRSGSKLTGTFLQKLSVSSLDDVKVLMNNTPSINHDVRENIIYWINSLILRIDLLDFNSKDKINNSYSTRLQNPQIVFKGIHMSRRWISLDPDDFTTPPFVDRYDTILETIEAIRKPQIQSYKPAFVLISTTMGMGKSTFLCECINKFLNSPHLIEKFIFGSTSIPSLSEIQKRLKVAQEPMFLHRADFVNKLNLAFSIRHFIPFECLDLNITTEKILYEALKQHMNTLFVGVDVITKPNSAPVWVRSIDQLLDTDQTITTTYLVQRFSNLIQLNAPKVANLFELPKNVLPNPLPLIFLIDSFHNINVDTSTKGSLYQLGLKWYELCTTPTPGISPAMVVAANSLPNQFLSTDHTFFSCRVVNLDLLFGASIFNDITFDLFRVRLNSTVMRELGFYANPTYHEVRELSPYLSRIIVSIFLMCSGNGRAIETFYHFCGADLRKMIAKEQDSNLHNREYDTILNRCTDAITNFARQYPVLTEETQKFDTPYLRLIKIMGCTMSPSTIVKDSNITIEDFQKLGWFVKTDTQIRSSKATYVGSFMMLKAIQEEEVPDLKNIGVCNGAFNHYHVCYQDLLIPFNQFRQVKNQGDHFENTIAGSIWARYCIACLHSNTKIGLPIPVEEVLPIEMIPEDCKHGKIVLRGVVKLHKQFDTFSTEQSLPSDRVILNLDKATFADIILPVSVNDEQKFIGIQTRYIKTKETQSKPNQVVKCMKQVLGRPNFSYLFISTYLPGSLHNFPNLNVPKMQNKEYLEQNLHKIKMAQPTNLVSVWWNMLMYDHHPDKRHI